jgi:hypothetical protein
LNKFAPLVFVLLLSCGAALWFLASDSLNFHIKNQLQNIGSELTEQKFTLEGVNILGYQGTGTITNLSITPPDSTNLLTMKKAILSIASIDLVMNQKSLKTELVIIESITINDLNASFYFNSDGTTLDNLLETVQENINKLAIKAHTVDQKEQLKITPPLIKVSQIIIKQGTLNLINDNNEQIITKALSDIKIEMTENEAGKKGEIIGIEIFEKLLIELNKHASTLQNKVPETM